MRLLQIAGVLLAVCGGVMLVAPRPLGVVVRLVTGVRLPEPHAASRAAAWGAVVLGTAMVVLLRAL